ncbi:MAG: FtsB/FtsL family cell division protein [Candidatus Dormibacteria bacterium]
MGVLLLLLAGLWVGSAFASKMLLDYRLNAQVTTLARDNQQLADANHGYNQQLAALSNPAGKDEALRQHNYTLPDEKVYVIVQPSPSPYSSPRSAAQSHRDDSHQSAWTVVWNTLTAPFRH